MRRLDLKLVLILAALAAGLALWLLLGRDESAGTVAVLGRAPTTAVDAARLPASDSGATLPATPQSLPATPEAETAAPDAAIAAATEPLAERAGEATIRGRVVDDKGLPIAGAAVTYWPIHAAMPLYPPASDAFGAQIEALPRALTDGAGRFDLPCRFRSDRKLENRGDRPELAVVAGDMAVRTVYCADFIGADLDVGDIALEPGARLRGRIVDESGVPIADAIIKPWNPRGHSLRGVIDPSVPSGLDELSPTFCATTSGVDGRFATGALWDGTAQLVISAEGFLDASRDHTPTTVGQRNDVGDIVLSRGAALTGLVRDDQRRPVVGARVFAWEATVLDLWARLGGEHDTLLNELSARQRSPSALTDDTGRFVLESQQRSNHVLCVDAAGFEPLRVSDVLPGRADLTLDLTRAATLALTVLDATTRKPLAAAQVQARRLSGWKGDAKGVELPTSAGAAPGTFVVSRLGARRTELVVSAPGYATRGVELGAATPPDELPLTLELAREAAVSGLVTTQDGTPLAEASVVAKPAAPEKPGLVKATTDAQGRFALTGISPGDWELVASAKGHGAVEQALEVREGVPRDDLVFALPEAASLFGVSYAGDGTRRAGHGLSFLWIDPAGRKNVEPLREATTDDQGRYALAELRPGTWRLLGKSPSEVTLAPGEHRKLDLHAEREARIEGLVLRADGTPVPHAWVAIHSAVGRGDVPFFECADASGHYAWTRNVSGRIALVAADADGGGMSAPLVLELQPGEQRLADLHLGGLQVRGRVVRTDGTPVAGARVHVLPLLDDDVPGTWSGISRGGVVVDFGGASDAQGRFVVGGLCKGRFTVSVSASGVRAEPQPTLVLDGGVPPELEIRVMVTGSLAGTVRLASGVPVKSGLLVTASAGGEQQTAGVSDGQFVLQDLLPGPWTLTVKEVGTVRLEQFVTVVAGQRLELELIVP